jgi:DNA polymerase I
MRRPQQLSHQEYHAVILGPLDCVVQQMERDGVCVSLERFKAIEVAATEDMAVQEAKLNTWSGKALKWSSPQQVAGFLHGDLALPESPVMGKVGQVKPGKVSVDDVALDWLISHCPGARDGLRTLREYRRSKRVVNYATSWAGMAVDRGAYATLHPAFGLSSDADTRPGAKTGRFAVKNPALNQVPGSEKDRFGLRSAFVAPPGFVVIACDASQLECVLIADKATRLFGTTIMTDHLKAADMHIGTAKYIYGEVLGDQVVKDTPEDQFKKNPHTAHRRKTAKNLRYGLHYRKSGYGFGSSLFDANGDPIGTDAGEALVEAMYGFEPELRWLHQYGDWWTRNKGYASSALGRWTWLDGWNSSRPAEQRRAARKEANWWAQATGQEILALALIGCSRDEDLRGMGFRIQLPVHDEIVAIVRESWAEEATARLQHYITHSLELLSPLGASGGWGENWAKAGGK